MEKNNYRNILELSDLKKRFDSNIVLDNVALKIGSNQCFCLIGKNGSGKSTLLNIIAGILSPDSGSLRLFDTSYEKNSRLIKKKIGVLPEFNPVIEEFNGIEYLHYVGYLYDLPKHLLRKRTNDLISIFFENLIEIKKPIGSFSRGMKIKIGLCSALIHKPELLILDEPFSGLDLISSHNLINFLNSYRMKGNTILISSHDILYIEKIATHIGLLDRGKIIYSDGIDKLLNGCEGKLDEKVSEKLGYQPKNVIEF